MTHWDVATFASTRAEVGRNCYGFCRVIAYESVWIRFPLGHYGPTGQGGSLHTYQYDLHQTATSIVV
jgi:hypothetical protein